MSGTSSDIAISVRNVSKMYPLYADPRDRLRQSLWYARPRLLRGSHPPEFFKEFWALQDVSFEVKRGETVGIIGRNGSGKSTLLQIIAGTLTPTGGEVQVNGRVAALLELGSGFNPEFTGRDNVYLNGSILGFSRDEMSELFDEIVAFADIGQFIDQPVKLYSSGMFVRLAFAVQACVKPDVLIVDEALAVGDVFFRQKCYARLEELMYQDTAVVLVTHSMTIVQDYCQNTAFLDKGRLMYFGESAESVRRFMMLERKAADHSQSPTSASKLPKPKKVPVNANHQQNTLIENVLDWPAPDVFFKVDESQVKNREGVRCTRIALCDEQSRPCQVFPQGEWAYIYSEYELMEDIGIPIGEIIVRNDRNIMIYGKTSLQSLWPKMPDYAKQGNLVQIRQALKLDLLPGEYTVMLGLSAIASADYAIANQMTHEEIEAKTTGYINISNQLSFTVTFRHDDGLTLLHHGLFNISGDCVVSVENSERLL